MVHGTEVELKLIANIDFGKEWWVELEYLAAVKTNGDGGSGARSVSHSSPCGSGARSSASGDDGGIGGSECLGHGDGHSSGPSSWTRGDCGCCWLRLLWPPRRCGYDRRRSDGESCRLHFVDAVWKRKGKGILNGRVNHRRKEIFRRTIGDRSDELNDCNQGNTGPTKEINC